MAKIDWRRDRLAHKPSLSLKDEKDYRGNDAASSWLNTRKPEAVAPPTAGYVAYFDGACTPINPGGRMGFGAYLLKDGARVWKHSGSREASPENSNNVAEYLAFIAVLDKLRDLQAFNEHILVRGDSQLLINQMFGSWRIKKGLYAEHAYAARERMRMFRHLRGEWVPRRQNVGADRLSKPSA